MKELVSIDSNTLYNEKERVHEVILITSEPAYKITNEFDIMRERVTTQFRFFSNDKKLEMFAKQLLLLTKEDKTEKSK